MHKGAISVIVAGFGCVFVSFAVRYAYGLLLPQMLPDLGLTKAQAGVIYAAYFLTYTIFSAVMGLLADRCRARMLLTLFIGLLGLGLLMMAMADTLLLAVVFFALVGLGQSAGWVPVVTLVQRWVPQHRRATAIAVVDLGSGTGILTVSLVIPWIAAGLGWRGVWICLGILGLMVAVLNFILIHDPPLENPTDRKSSVEPGLIKSYGMVMAILEFWLIGLAYCLICFCIIIPFTFLTAFAVLDLDIPFRQAAWLVGMIALSGLGGKLSLGHLSDKIGRVPVMMLCAAFTGAGSLGMAFSNTFYGLLIAAAVFGLGYGAIWPVYAAAAGDIFNKAFAGRIVGLWTLFLGLGSMAAPVLAGWSVDASGRYFWAFVLAAAAAMLSAAALVPVWQLPTRRLGNDVVAQD